MRAVWIRFRAELRTRWRAWLGLALLVGLAAGAVMTLAAGARRTDSAYSRFLRAQNAYDVVIVNYPEDGTAVFDFDDIERLPQVADSARADFEYYTFEAGNLVSEDGRIGTDINRFKILEGRRADPRQPDEAVVGFTLAEEHGIEIGDKVDVIPREYIELARSGATEDPTGEASPEDIAAIRRLLQGIPDGKLRIVGIEAAPGEFPPQFALNRPLVHLTPALHHLFQELQEQDHQALMVRLRGGSAAADDFLAELEQRSTGRSPQVIVQRDHAAAVQRSVHFQALALWLLAGLTALVAVLILVQLLARLVFLESTDHATLQALGMTLRDRVVLGVLRAVGIGAVGAVVGVTGALLASRFFPTGLARTAEPAPGFDADLLVLLAGGAWTLLIVTAVSVWPAWRAARLGVDSVELEARTGRWRLGRALAIGGLPAPAGIGVRMALVPGRGSNAVPVRTTLSGVTLGIVALVGALTFGASLAHLLDTPRLYGVTWDLELANFVDDELVRKGPELLRDDPRVSAVARGTAGFPIEVEGEPVGVIVLRSVQGEVSLPMLKGRGPAAPDEIALGARTLKSRNVEVGDAVEVGIRGADAEPVPMRVVGTAVFPTVGETARLGEGALVTPAGAAVIDPSEEEVAEELFVRLESGADSQAVVAELNEELEEEAVPVEQGEPTDIVNFGRVEAMPFVLGAVLAALSAATLAHLLFSAVRRRRRDLAVLKTLGFVRGQIAGAVAVQATTVIVLGLFVGVPVGIAVGRWTWALMAENLGVLSRPQVPVLTVLVLPVAALLLANAIAFVPGQLAARTRATTDLRAE